MVMCFETDVFVDTEAYDTSRIPVVKNFFLSLFRRRVESRMSRCAAGGDSNATFGVALFLEPENFTRTDQVTESSYRVSARMRPAEQHSFARYIRVSLDRFHV